MRNTIKNYQEYPIKSFVKRRTIKSYQEYPIIFLLLLSAELDQKLLRISYIESFVKRKMIKSYQEYPIKSIVKRTAHQKLSRIPNEHLT